VAKSYCALPALIAVLTLATFLPSQSRADSESAQELAKKVVDNEAKAANNDQSRWSYESIAEKSGRKEERAVIETKDGNIDRLISINGQPLTPVQQKKENDRIQKLLKNPSEQKKEKEAQQKDAQEMIRSLKLLPQALLFSYGSQRGGSIQLLFKPNPQFHAHSNEARVLNALAGELWVDSKENRIEEIKGHLIRDVRFWGGLAGHLNKGGQFYVKQVEAAPGHWLLSKIDVQMNGKALFFKTISVRQIESHTHFQRVSDDLTLAQAAQVLSRFRTLAQADRGRNTPLK
jgi:hypothetical protein